jgi:hypothetical protein
MNVDQETLERFVGPLLEELGGAFILQLICSGDELGPYRAMADAAPVTPTELAREMALGLAPQADETRPAVTPATPIRPQRSMS